MKKIALTFDDGPWEATTPHVLDVLEKYNIPATFMIWGEHAKKYPEILKREAENSLFTIGNHTYSHIDLTKVNSNRVQLELKKDDEIIRNITGDFPEVIRPPFGAINNNILPYLTRPAIIWSLDTKSWDHHDKKKVLLNITKAVDGDIILMHDFQLADSEAIENVISFLLENEFEILSLQDLVGKKQFSKAKVIYSANKIIE
ncbi:polysaccharide deacetylase family protein [Limosilactobacillus walteri]|uniref:polysaccharide deacetylase family protein n=1 Tax=Limosilactobacillus walteri TaxID=2268022 RepID=UPI0017827914|nr:polysaccharide deacetylase family protein [Limosilactobacillus walteri]